MYKNVHTNHHYQPGPRVPVTSATVWGPKPQALPATTMDETIGSILMGYRLDEKQKMKITPHK